MSNDEIEAWISEKGGGDIGLAKLDEAYRQGLFSGVREAAVGRFLHHRKELQAARNRLHDQGLTERAVVAAESQADTAKQALERANIAIVISIVTALITIVGLLVTAQH